ncbi:MAG: DNA excision repair protein ERCC-2 [Candidatus Azotimanducaceae bacterium]|jgi:DNA excision repair protein ERCC-2
MIRSHVLSVREMAKVLFTRGDLFPVSASGSVDPELGIMVQKSVQHERLELYEGYRREVSFRSNFLGGYTDWTIQGRADGCYVRSGVLVIEEFKCTRVHPDEFSWVDYGQCLLYAALAVVDEGFESPGWQRQLVEVEVIYVEPETLREKSFNEQWRVADLQLALAFLLTLVDVRWQRHQSRVQRRIDWSQSLQFPVLPFRKGQQAIARRVFTALRDRQHLLLEAPTGSGKSLAVLYPVARSLDHWEQAVFLTSRNSGSEAALLASRQISNDQSVLSVVEIIAKEKACFVEGMPCRADLCEYAKGYFDRVGEAVDAVIEAGVVDHQRLAELAKVHRVCPFELSLDAALWTDLIVGDYNYVFDPVVRLKRLVDHKHLQVLVDEAHQLAPRAQEMLKVELRRSSFRKDKNLPSAIQKRMASIDRALMKLRQETGQGIHQIENLDSVHRAVAKFLQEVAELDLSLRDLSLGEGGEFQDTYFACHRWHRSSQWIEPEVFANLVEVEGRSVVVRQICLDAGPWIQQVIEQHGASVRFSATLTPLALYQRAHGYEDAHSERAPNPFRESQLAVFIVPDVPTYFRERQRSLSKLQQLISNIGEAKPGHYLIALPSYSYLKMVSEVVPGENYCQSQGMSREELSSLIADFAQAKTGYLFIVLGGSLGESVNLTGVTLQGVVVVGLGLPPPSLERQLTAQYFDHQESDGWGQRIAYTQPALAKIQQAAGRLIRGDEDRGIIFLVDPRFRASEIDAFQPAHWQPKIVATKEIVREVHAFWDQAPTASE